MLTSDSIKPQTQQGADILADTLKAHVIMPDFFEPGAPWSLEEFPPKTAEEKGKLQAFFGGAASPKDNTTKLYKLGKQLKADGAGFLVAYGFCWGKSSTYLVTELRQLHSRSCRRKGCYARRKAARHSLRCCLDHPPCVSNLPLYLRNTVSHYHYFRMVSAEDAEKLQVPYGFYYTKDEPKEEVRSFFRIFSKDDY